MLYATTHAPCMTWSQNLSLLPRPLKLPLACTQEDDLGGGATKGTDSPWVSGGVEPLGVRRERRVKGGAQPRLGVGTVGGCSRFILTCHLILQRTFWKSEGGGYSEGGVALRENSGIPWTQQGLERRSQKHQLLGGSELWLGP